MSKRTKKEQEEYLRMLRERTPSDIAKVRAIMSLMDSATKEYEKELKNKKASQNDRLRYSYSSSTTTEKSKKTSQSQAN